MSNPLLAEEVMAYYANGFEAERLKNRAGRLELARTQELVMRHVLPAPAVIYDIGGGPGAYACWLARLGYEVHLVDALPLHVELARQMSAAQPDTPLASVSLGDARALGRADESVDVALLFGPLYHLTERSDRLAALREARRVLRPGGLLLAVGISRFVSTLDGLRQGFFDDPLFEPIAEQDLQTGQHRNATNHLGYFTTAFFHHPDELHTEIETTGMHHDRTLPIEGPGWLIPGIFERWDDVDHRERVLAALRRVEHEPSLLGVSAHLLAIAHKDPS